MYVPKIHEAPSLDAVEKFIKENGFATIISQHNGSCIATHTPLMIREKDNGNKCLVGHISIGNEQKTALQNCQELMAIFMEHHTYISSSWYDHINVPTWNYIAVHVYGKANVIEGEELYKALDELVNKYENDDSSGFNIRQMPPDMLDREMKGIVGFEINVTKVEASYKLSQNRDDTNYKMIIDKLMERGDEFSIKIAQEMQQLR